MSQVFKGLDVSRFQENIDWNKVKDDGYTFVIIRIGYGKKSTQKDVMFEKHYLGALTAGLEIGGYWYSYAEDSETAIEEAKACLECIKGKKFSYPIYYDVEESKIINNNSKSTNTNIVNSFCKELTNSGYLSGFYTFESALSNFNLNNIPYEKWLAKWSNSMDDNSIETFSMWQHGIIGSTIDSTIKGKVSGINGDVDVDKAFKDFTKLTGISFASGDISKITQNNNEEKKTIINENKTPQIQKFNNGDSIILENTPIYSSCNSNNPLNSKSGTYYIYSNEIRNDRIRITNSKNNVGKLPIGNYVTGWVKVNNVVIKNNNKIIINSNNRYDDGELIKLNGAGLYSSSSSSTICQKITGNYYIYSSDITNNRIRITNSKNNVGKTPCGKYVTGWIKLSDIK